MGHTETRVYDMSFNIKERNAEIVQKRKTGVSYKVIASEFRLSRSRIEQIVNRFQEEEKRQEQSGRLLSEIRILWFVTTCQNQMRCFIKLPNQDAHALLIAQRDPIFLVYENHRYILSRTALPSLPSP
ncbi:MAG: helix-turn-helix domain-containing protein [Candidatus Tectomicrobia bacterium]|uniref:Helix-turn-helix domain-containing protein n=1 Tax=Tectimicrobiota bacterium TaxID=2528274 RepID=A0A933LQ44_UNCTE|nr:helix-turn-helix domain-containing protein [Candidatus Tectomicrobia bacterium]